MFDDGAVGEPGPTVGHQAQLLVVEPHAVHPDHARAQHAELVEQPDRRGPVLGERALALVLALGGVDVELGVGLFRDLPAGADHRGRGPVGTVRGRLHGHQRVPGVRADQLGHPPRRVRGRLAIAGGRAVPVVHGAGQHEADAHVARGADDRLRVLVAVVLKVEEVHAGGGAVQQHLGEGERRAHVDPLAVQARGVGVEHAVAPGHEVEIVAQAAQQGLERVAVGVHGAGQEGLPGQPDDVGGRGGVGRGRRFDRGDAAVGDGDHVVAQCVSAREDHIRLQAHPTSGAHDRRHLTVLSA